MSPSPRVSYLHCTANGKLVNHIMDLIVPNYFKYVNIDTSLLFQLALLVSLAYCIIWITYTRWFHPLAQFPGPFWASVSRIWTVLHVLPGNAEKTQRKLHEKYGLGFDRLGIPLSFVMCLCSTG
jgi:hypothetical protein